MGVKYIEDINDEAMDAWIVALRSGDFKQTTGALGNKHGHCCLGVYCEINPDVVKNDLEDDFGDWGYKTAADDYAAYLLPSKSALESLNLPEEYMRRQASGMNVLVNRHGDEEPDYWRQGDDVVTLSQLNDNTKLTFNQIADRLEETFLRKESV